MAISYDGYDVFKYSHCVLENADHAICLLLNNKVQIALYNFEFCVISYEGLAKNRFSFYLLTYDYANTSDQKKIPTA